MFLSQEECIRRPNGGQTRLVQTTGFLASTSTICSSTAAIMIMIILVTIREAV